MCSSDLDVFVDTLTANLINIFSEEVKAEDATSINETWYFYEGMPEFIPSSKELVNFDFDLKNLHLKDVNRLLSFLEKPGHRPFFISQGYVYSIRD